MIAKTANFKNSIDAKTNSLQAGRYKKGNQKILKINNKVFPGEEAYLVYDCVIGKRSEILHD